MASLPTPNEGIALTHFIVTADVERAGRFYTDVLGAEIVLAGEPTIVALANSWIINLGGGPTDDKPNVILEPPRDPDHVRASAAPSSLRLQSTAGRRPAATSAIRTASLRRPHAPLVEPTSLIEGGRK